MEGQGAWRGRMSTVSRNFVDYSRHLLTADYLPKLDTCLERLTDADVWARPNEASNSVGNLILHLCGNVTQWIIGGVGGKAYERHRQQEFDERTAIPGRELIERLRRVVERADEVLRDVDAEALSTRRQIQGYDVTVLEAIYHVVEHFSMHTGQIIVMTKAKTGADLKLWQPETATPAT
jgi:uncharacterized damage-inducible protein DinB